MILIGGENLIDFIEDETGKFSANPGGGPFNIAKAIARQNQPSGYLTPISKDQMGDRLAADLEDSGVTLLAPRSDAPSSLALVSLVDGQPNYQFYREKTAERAVTSTLLNRIIPKEATALQLGSLALASGKDAENWAQIYVAFHKRGKFTSLDPNIRPAFIKKRRKFMARLQWVLAHTDMLKLSDEDLAWIAPEQNPEEAAKALQAEHNIPLVVLTKGESGALGFQSENTIVAPAHKADPFVDAVGAGDTFMGTLLVQLTELGLLSRPALTAADPQVIQACLSKAAMAAAINCTRSGCNPPYKDELTG